MLALVLLLTLSLSLIALDSGFGPQATFAHNNNLSLPTGPRTLLKMVKKSKAIPKEETGVYDLFEQYPKADGRGVKIAIFDTGCDLAARGLVGAGVRLRTSKQFTNLRVSKPATSPELDNLRWSDSEVH